MKRVLVFVLALAMVLVAVSASALTWATVSNPNAADRLNLRAKPSQDAISYGKYYSGTQVQILSGPSDGWYRVRVGTGNGIGELEGYMMAKYLVTGERASQTRDMRPTVTLKSRDGSRIKLLNFFDGSCMGRVSSGTRATVLGVGTKYIHVVTEGGSTGFVEAELAEPRLYYAQP